jgi:hypothetical protein
LIKRPVFGLRKSDKFRLQSWSNPDQDSDSGIIHSFRHRQQTASRPSAGCWVFRAIVFKSRTCRGFVGYGDADPPNVSPLVHGAEMRVAETRAVNRALRKAYGIGICSVEEIGSFAEPVPSPRESKKLPPQPVNGKNGNYGGPKVRDRLCQLIRQHQLDANLVKSYAVDFREATCEQVEAFVARVRGSLRPPLLVPLLSLLLLWLWLPIRLSPGASPARSRRHCHNHG